MITSPRNGGFVNEARKPSLFVFIVPQANNIPLFSRVCGNGIDVKNLKRNKIGKYDTGLRKILQNIYMDERLYHYIQI